MALLLRPLDDTLADQLVELARLSWTDGATAAAVAAFGWIPDGSRMNAFTTPGGHPVYPESFGYPAGRDTECVLPFAYAYEPDEDDFEGEREGCRTNLSWFATFYDEDDRWHFQRMSGRADFDEAWRAATALFTARLGEPDVLTRVADGDEDVPAWHYAAWRCGDNALVVGQCSDAISYSTFEQAVVWLGAYPAARPWPEAGEFWRLLEG
ncbi:hypothetical protein LRS74_25960 [Streptomyces sp. LX-29]|uniref:hypothetical protein n=1 Tax=Streptomyces sp. LX-29 TaxID=2900152 RepID=UPI00240E8CB3|nr:hypothetical protein [Streptomyces sp. LX-29]WFB10100.1 hypothetical protein LRS74_25960 [Streptomyces sp. LX-29]